MAKAIWIILGIIGLGLVAVVFGVTQSTFDIEQGYEPYGESPNEITGLERDVSEEGNFAVSEAEYWTIKRSIEQYNGNNFEGNDFELRSSSSVGRYEDGPIQYITKRMPEGGDFKINLESTSASYSVRTSDRNTFEAFLVTEDEEIKVLDETFSTTTSSFEISPSVATSEIDILWNSNTVNTVNLEEAYELKIVVEPITECGGTYGPGECVSAGHIISNPRYKQQFGCSTETDEQVYVETYRPNSTVNLEGLNNFQKFCLDELPTQIISNTGATTDESVPQQLVEGNEFTVPTGQIWAIPYIGEKGTLETECEESEVYSGGECFARGAITYSCPDGSFDTETLSCQVTTEPVEYQPTSIETHQDLETEGSVRFDHQVSDAFDESTTKSFNILGNTFVSDGVSYSGNTETDSLASEEPNNFATQVNIAGQSYSLSEGDSQTLGDFLNVEIANLEADYDAPEDNLPGGIENFNVQYDLGIDRSILDVEGSNGEVVVTNNADRSIEGGLVVRRTDNTQQTSIETQDETFSSGENSFSFNTENLTELRIRPFATIETDAYEYNIDGETALILEIEDGELVSSERVDSDTLEPIKEEIEEGEGFLSQIPTIVWIILAALAVIVLLIIAFSNGNQKKQRK